LSNAVLGLVNDLPDTSVAMPRIEPATCLERHDAVDGWGALPAGGKPFADGPKGAGLKIAWT